MGTFAVIAFMVIALSCLLYKAHLNTRQVALNEVRLGDSPDENHAPGLSVLHISDMHVEHISISPEQLYALLSRKKIDLIALTGDFLDRKSSIPKLAPYLRVFKELKPRYGIYAVLGNHDYVLNAKHLAKLKRLLEDYGCKLLQNDHDSLLVQGKRMNIIGIDDFSTQRSDLARSYRGVEDGFNLVLTHDPNVVLDMNGFDCDYMLAGHFHGGQIHWPKPYHLVKMGKLVRMNMVKGLQTYQGKLFYISEGLGQTGINIRVGSRPEITLHHVFLRTPAAENADASEAV